MAHEPGPWMFDGRYIRTTSRKVCKEYAIIAEVLGGNYARPHNAPVLTMSPELLHLCKLWICKETGGSLYPELFEESKDAVSLTKAMIAKVEG